MGIGDERLPDGFSFDDFLDAVRDADARAPRRDDADVAAAPPDDADLPTDADGCVELATLPATDLPAFLGRLREAGFSPHVEMPDGEPLGSATATVFVPRPRLDEARRLMGLQA